MVSKEVSVNCPLGLTMQPAGVICTVAGRYKCKILMEHAHGITNLKSMLSVLGSSIKPNERVIVSCDGDDEDKALEALVQTFETELMGEI